MTPPPRPERHSPKQRRSLRGIEERSGHRGELAMGICLRTSRRFVRQGVGVRGSGETPDEDLVESQLRHHHVGGDPCHVEEQQFLVEASVLGFSAPVLHLGEVAIVHVYPSALKVQPAPAVHDTSAPTADFADRAIPALGSEIVGLKARSVVDGEIPVAVGAVLTQRPGSAQRNCLHSWQLCEFSREPGQEIMIILHAGPILAPSGEVGQGRRGHFDSGWRVVAVTSLG